MGRKNNRYRNDYAVTARDRWMSDEDYQDELMAASAFSNHLWRISIYPDGTARAARPIPQILPGVSPHARKSCRNDLPASRRPDYMGILHATDRLCWVEAIK